MDENAIPIQERELHQIEQAELSASVLRGLISYHRRMTMGNYPERDFYLEALKFALDCVLEKM